MNTVLSQRRSGRFLALLGISAVLAVSFLTLRSDAILYPDDVPTEPHPIGPPTMISGGSFQDVTWNLSHVLTDDGAYCVNVSVTGTGITGESDGGACDFGVPAESVIGATTDGFGAANVTLAYGPVAKAIRTVRLAFNDGSVMNVPTIVAPSLTVDFFIAAKTGLPLLVTATGLDLLGNPVGSQNLMGE